MPAAVAADQARPAPPAPVSNEPVELVTANGANVSDTPPSRWRSLPSALGSLSSARLRGETGPGDRATSAMSTSDVTSGPEAVPALAAAPPREGRIVPTALWSPPLEPAPGPTATRPTTDVGFVEPPEPDVRRPDGLTVCPYLGTRDDPATRFDFPYAGNMCHAGVAAKSGSAFGGRLLQGFQRMTHQGPQPIAIDQQAALCLTADHVQCPRYVQVTPAPMTQAGGSGADAPSLPQVTTARRAHPAASEASGSAPIPPHSTATPAKPRHLPSTKVTPGQSAPATPTFTPPSPAAAASRRRGAGAAGPPTTLTYPPRPTAAQPSEVTPTTRATPVPEPAESTPHDDKAARRTAKRRAGPSDGDGASSAGPAAHVTQSTPAPAVRSTPTPSAAKATPRTSKSAAKDTSHPNARRPSSASRASTDAAASVRTAHPPAAAKSARATNANAAAATRSGTRSAKVKSRPATSGASGKDVEQRSGNNRAGKAPDGTPSTETTPASRKQSRRSAPRA